MDDKTAYPRDGRPLHNPSLRQVIRIGVMLRDAVIPDRQIVLLPAPAHLKLGFRDMRKQEAEQRLALFLRYVHDTRGKPFIHKQRLLSGHRMRTHHRVQQRRMFSTASSQRWCSSSVLRYLYSGMIFEVMLRPQAAQ